MHDSSRRSFCQFCLTAGLIGSGLSHASEIAKNPESEPIPKAGNESEKSLDYSLIGYCGYRCDICPGRSEDKELRRKMVEGWKKIYGHTNYTEENIPIAKPCGGCKGNSEIADTSCKARPCAMEKKVVTCADCDQFGCEKMRGLIADRQRLILACRGKDVTREEYELSAMQFESLPVLLARMSEIGKLPGWVKDILEIE